MYRIREILDKRKSRDHYYTDCDRGQKITDAREVSIVEVTFEVETWSDNKLLKTLRRIIAANAMTDFYATFDVGYRPELKYDARQVAEALVIDRLVEQRVRKLEADYGCSKYARCLDCPDGLHLAAAEIYAYSTGGSK